MTFLDVTVCLGGLALFLHGLTLAKEGLQTLAGDKLRSIITAVTANRFAGLTSGIGVTMILQSSTATTVMLVGFAGSGVLTLPQAMAVLLGADIGTTFTVQLLSFRLSKYALLIAFVGFAIRFFSKKRRPRYLGETLFGFGLLFLGLKLMAEGASPLTLEPGFASAMLYFAANPLLGLLAGAVITVLMQGSAPTIGLLLSLALSSQTDESASSVHFTLAAALPIILGANVGTTVTPALAAVGQDVEGRRVAMAHVARKVLGAAIFLPLLPWYETLVVRLSGGDLIRQIANAHTLFNVLLAALFLPFTELTARVITRLYQPPVREKFGPRYLDPQAIATPPLAFGLAQREFLRMCDIVGSMTKDVMVVYTTNNLDLLEEIEARDDKVDILNREIRFYLAQIAQENLSHEQAERQITLITLTSDIENIGDTVNKNLLPLARKKAALGLQFSTEGAGDLAEFHRRVCQNYDLAVAAFTTNDEELARKVLRHHDKLTVYETELKARHISRLTAGMREALETSSIHLDVLSLLRRVNFLLSGLAEVVVATHHQQDQARKAS